MGVVAIDAWQGTNWTLAQKVLLPQPYLALTFTSQVGLQKASYLNFLPFVPTFAVREPESAVARPGLTVLVGGPKRTLDRTPRGEISTSTQSPSPLLPRIRFGTASSVPNFLSRQTLVSHD